MSFTNAYYDTFRKEIVGCKKYSLIWWHEYRHMQQDKVGFIYLWSMTNLIGIAVLTAFWLCELSWSWFTIPVFILFIPNAVIEIDAWIYAIINYRGLK